MREKALAPAIRFVGFTDAWEQRKLGGLVQFSKGTGYSKADLKEKGTPIILYGRLYTKYETVISDVDTYADSRDGSVYSRGGEVIVPASGETAEDISVASVVEKPGILLGGDLNIITPPADLDPAFLAISISNGKPHDDMAKMAQGKSVVHLHNADLEKIDFMYPCYTEQMQISTYFKNLDHLITLQQRKYSQLCNIKKSMLERMFPKEGASVPEIRFAGFTDAWERRKALELAEYFKGNGYSKGDLTEVGTPIILYGRLYTKYQLAIDEVDTFVIPKSGSVYSQGNEVIVPASGETAEDIARASAVEKSGVLLGGDLNILRPFDFIDPLFLALAISNGGPQKELAKKAQGKSVVHIHNSDIQEVTISYPLRAEQDQIVAVFRHLDHLITLHQRKLERLQNIKTACLEKMFV